MYPAWDSENRPLWSIAQQMRLLGLGDYFPMALADDMRYHKSVCNHGKLDLLAALLVSRVSPVRRCALIIPAAAKMTCLGSRPTSFQISPPSMPTLPV